MVPSLELVCRSLLAQICPTTTLIIVTHQSTEARVNLWLEESRLVTRCKQIIVKNNTPLSMWVQDDLHIIKDHNGALSLLVSQQAKPHVRSLIRQIAGVADVSFAAIENAPDGGNILAGDRLILIGDNDCNGSEIHNLSKCFVENSFAISSRIKVPPEMMRALPAIGENWQEVIHFGNKTNTHQPVFHIDIFLSLAGRSADNRPCVLVGDPGLAARLLNWSPLTHSLQEAFDDIASQLECAGFDVVRNPLPLVYCDNPGKQQRQWYFSSSNNAIVQDCDTAGRIVWLPTYGHGNWPELAVTDEVNIEIWQGLGFDVRPIAHCQSLAENLGGLRCFSKTWAHGEKK